MKKGLKSIYETKFIVGGVVWNVWDWTIFVFILGFIVVGGLIAFLICCCCYPNRYDDEYDAVKEQNNMSMNDSLRERDQAAQRLSASLAAAGAATMDAPERDIYKNAPEKKDDKPMEEMMME